MQKWLENAPLGIGRQWHLSCPLTLLFYFLC